MVGEDMGFGANKIDAVNVDGSRLHSFLPIKAGGLDELVQMMTCSRYIHHALEARQHDLIEETPHLRWRLAQTNRRADLRTVASVTCGKLHDHHVAVFERTAGGSRVAEDQRGIFHGRRADDREIEIASPFENGASGSGFELIFGHTRPAASH